jgi:hypothetical protein
MNVAPIMDVTLANVLRIQLPKYCDNDDLVLYIQQPTKVCVTNGKDTYDHKIQYFPNSLRKIVTNWFIRYEIAHPIATRNQVQRTFITQFNEIQNERQVVATLHYAQQKNNQWRTITIDSYDYVQLFHNNLIIFIFVKHLKKDYKPK